jgi:CRP-like cAMP-binding protein
VYRTVPQGAVVFRQGEAITSDSCVYIVLDGSVKIYVQDAMPVSESDIIRGDSELVTVLHRGSVFGESGTLGSGTRRSATAIAASMCQFATVSKCVMEECVYFMMGESVCGGESVLCT